MDNFKRSIEFIDDNNKRIRADVEITRRNGYPEFTMSGSMDGCGGQIFNRVKPANEHQNALLFMWRTFHCKDVSGVKGFDRSLAALLDHIEAAEAARPDKGLEGDDALLDKMDQEGISEDALDAVKAYMECFGIDDLKDFEEAYAGEFSNDEAFAQEIAEQTDAISGNASWPNNCIDWEQAARELMQDYSEQDGYYFRNI